MGRRGGYRGGGTLLSPNGWVVRRVDRTGQDKEVIRPIEEPKKSVSGDGYKRKIKRVRQEKPKSTDVELQKREYVALVVHEIISGHTHVSLPPKLIRSTVMGVGNTNGEVLRWAKSQECYRQILDAKLSRYKSLTGEIASIFQEDELKANARLREPDKLMGEIIKEEQRLTQVRQTAKTAIDLFKREAEKRINKSLSQIGRTNRQEGKRKEFIVVRGPTDKSGGGQKISKSIRECNIISADCEARLKKLRQVKSFLQLIL